MPQKDLFRIMFECATTGILIVKQNGKIYQANEFAEQLFGYASGELIDVSVEELVPDSIRSRHQNLRHGYHKNPKQRTMGAGLELFAKRKDGQLFPTEISLGHATYQDERMVIAFVNDVSEQKLAEEQLKESRLKLANYASQLEHKVKKRTAALEKSQEELYRALEKEKELGRLKSRFVSMASHEFRTPLSSVLSSAELIEMYLEANKPEGIPKNINRIRSSIRNLTDILNDFLSLEKLEAGKVDVQKKEVPLAEFLQELKEEVQPLLQANHQFQIEETTLNTLRTDAFLLKNILLNLISNAIKYSPQGGKILLTIEIIQNALKIRVKDEGLGIPEEDKKYMLSRFFRASNVENIQGTGLGLTIVLRYLEILGGSLAFESQLGEGSTFTVQHPL